MAAKLGPEVPPHLAPTTSYWALPEWQQQREGWQDYVVREHHPRMAQVPWGVLSYGRLEEPTGSRMKRLARNASGYQTLGMSI
jgi:hypothetical protein